MIKMFTERLKQLRKQANLTQKEISEKLGISQPQYARTENGGRAPSKETLELLSSFFGVSIDYLLGKTDNPSRGFETDLEEALDNALSFNGKPMSDNDREKIKAYLTDYFKNKDDDLS